MNLKAFALGVAIGIAAFLACSRAHGSKVAPHIKTLVIEEAINHGFDPDLAIAIMEVESNGNPNAIGKLGEQGLFQLRPEFHHVAPGDVRGNVVTAIRYLNRLRAVCGPTYGDAFYICHNTGPYRRSKLKEPKKFPYYKKVNALYEKRKKRQQHASN